MNFSKFCKSYTGALSLSLILHLLIFIPFVSSLDKVTQHYSKKRGLKISLKSSKTRFMATKKLQKKIIKKKLAKGKLAKKRVPFKKKKITQNRVEQNKKKEVHQNLGKSTLLTKYLTDIRQQVLINKYYPRVAKKLKQQGRVVITFEVVRPNTIKNIKIIKKSKYNSLNNAALEAINRINNLRVIPSELNRKSVKVQVPLTYENI